MDNMTATVKATLQATGTLNRTFGDAVPSSLNYNPSTSFAFGNGAKQANTFYRAARTLTASSTEDLDLSGGLTDDFGATITLTEIKALYIENTSATETLSVGGAASNAIAALFGAVNDIIKIPPKGRLLLWTEDATGWAVVAATGDILKVANSGGASTTYNIVIIGN